MLSQKNRLVKKKDFDAAFKQGKTLKEGFLLFKILKNNLPQSRFGFVVSKKVSSKAVERNAIKRRLRSVVAEGIATIEEPSDVVVVALSGAGKEDTARMQAAVRSFFQKINV